MAVGGLLLATLFVSATVFARTPAQKKQLAREQFETAQRMLGELNATPESQRSRRDYQRVMEAYRRVYYLSPASTKADESVVAVGDLLVEIGRRFAEPDTLQDAVGQYQFLRHEYPGSKFRVAALYAIGFIYKNDLNKADDAKQTFEEFLKHYPRSPLAESARGLMSEIDPTAASSKTKKQRSTSAAVSFTCVREAVLGSSPSNREVAAKSPQKDEAGDKPASSTVSVAEEKSPNSEHKFVPLVTGIRYWSTPDYTRVAIDLESEVQYEAGRVANPDRIFFDLHETRLASSLVGKTFEVEDGFLRKIRIAQYQRGLTRVVLDVDDVSDYSAFLLPNPYRLIVDIHGKKPARAIAKKTGSAPSPAKPQTVVSTPVRGAAINANITASAAAPETEPAKASSAKMETATVEAQPTLSGKKSAAELRTVDATAGDVNSDGTPTAGAKLNQTELRATSKPTSAPTFESVAPRDEILPRSTRRKRKPEPQLAHEARPTSTGERSLTRALGLKIGRIVVDAGHGGHDTGTVGPNGLQEKDLVLDVALRLGKLLQTRMGADVIYTRSDDTFVPLETRTAIANQQQADLFISIHANSSRDPSARGIETYYLNFTSSPDALEVAARENAVSQKSIHELQDLVKKITLRDKIDESREFAADVQRSLYSGIGARTAAIRNRGVKKAPFIVLIGANMPSILAEISFLSNPTDEKRLLTPQYRQKVAEYLYRGITRYTDGLSGLKVASQTPSGATTNSAKAADPER